MKAKYKQEAIITNNTGIYKGQAEVTVTADSVGKTLSLKADGVQITIALEPVLERLKNK